MNKKFNKQEGNNNYNDQSETHYHNYPQAINKAIRFVDLPNLDVTVYGREVELGLLINFFATHKKYCSIVAPSCFGKTFLIRKFLQQVSECDEFFKDSFDKIIYFNCRETTDLIAIIGKFEICLGVKIEPSALFSLLQDEKILCIFDNFESWKNAASDVAKFLHRIFTENNHLRTIFVSQSPINDANIHAEEIAGMNDKLFRGLDEKSALEFIKAESIKKKVSFEDIPTDELDEKLNEFFKLVHYIPQAIRSLIGYLSLDRRRSFSNFMANYQAEFTEYEKSEKRFTENYNDEFRPTLYLIKLQLEAQDEKSQNLLSVLSFFERDIPQIVVDVFSEKVDVTEQATIDFLASSWLIETLKVFRGREFYYYSPHSIIKEVAREVLPKFEDRFSTDFELLAKALFHEAIINHDRQHNYEEATNLYRCVEKLYEYLVHIQTRTELSNDLGATYMNKGVSLNKLGKLNEALVEYEKSISIRKGLVNSGQDKFTNDLARTYMNKGVSLAGLGRLNEAIIEYDKFILIYEDLVKQGERKFANDLAMTFMNKGVSLQGLGASNKAIIEYDKAIAIYEDLIEQDRNEFANYLADVFINKGSSLDTLGKLTEAISEYDKAIKILFDLVNEKGRVEFADRLAAAYVNKGNVYKNLGKLKQAIFEYDEAITILKNLIKNGRVELYNNLASAYLNKGASLRSLGKLNEAIIEYDKAIVIRKDLVENGQSELADHLAMAYMNKGNVYKSLGKLDEAIIEQDKAIKILKDLVENGRSELADVLASAYENKGISLRSLNKLEASIIEYDKAIEIRITLIANGRTELAYHLASAYMNKGISLRNLHKLNKAIIEYDSAIAIYENLVANGRIELSDDLALTYQNKGVALRHLGKSEEAIIEQDKAITILKDLVENGRSELANDLATAYMNKGNVIQQLGKFNESIIEYDKAISILKDLVENNRTELFNVLAIVYLNKGNSLDSLGKLNEAIAVYRNAINLWEETLQRGEVQNLPNLAICLGNHIFAHRKAGNVDLARKDMLQLHQLLEFTKQHKDIEHLGEDIQKQIDRWSK